ncbi:MAG: polyprenyl synthetase family protein [Myxococcota bacterium]
METDATANHLDQLSPSAPIRPGLVHHIHRVHARVIAAVEAPIFCADQRRLLRATVERELARGGGQLGGDPLSTMLLLARAQGPLDEETTARVGAFWVLYVVALDLFDDVQDEDLEGTPHAEAGPAIAVNSAITLSFLATRELHGALPYLPTDEARSALLEIADEAARAAVAGQHRDLLGSSGAATPDEVLAMQQGKTSSVILLAECAGLLAGAAPEARHRLRRLGESLAVLVQVRDDLRDIFGKAQSPDLATGKVTYPLACFYEDADAADRHQLETLLRELPESMPKVRTLLYESGAVKRSAEALERCRRTIHEELAALEVAAPGYLRIVIDIVDELASSVYAVPAYPPTAAMRKPGSGPFARQIVAALGTLEERLRPLGLPEDLPALVPWHLPHWMYSQDRHTIFFPDMDDLSEEIAPFQAQLLGTDDLADAREQLTHQIPLVLAHEFFHFWRDAAGRLTRDHWHEEWAANTLSAAYALEYEPDTLRAAVALADRVRETWPGVIGEREARILADCHHERPERTGYGMGPLPTAVVGLEMVRNLAAELPRSGRGLSACVAEQLTGEAPAPAV